MDAYKIQLSLHVLAVFVGLGSTYAFPFVQAFAERQGVGATRFAIRAMRHIEKFLVRPAIVLITVLGVGLIFDDGTGYKDDFPAWLGIAIGLFVLAIALGVGVQDRNSKSALASLEGVPDNGSFPAAYLKHSQRMQMVGGVLGLLIAVIMVLMVYKPDW